jgi:hypothetical protein
MRFPEHQIPELASRYSYPKKEQYIENRIVPAVRNRGHLNKKEFSAICLWKTPRSRPKCAKNREEFIEEVTRIALTTIDEELKISVLLLLSGVGWPTASVILHFCDRGQYPIIDYRALWSVGIDPPPVYDFPFWWEYCEFVRGLADHTGHSMRIIDRALWQYSKENQNGEASDDNA